HPAVRTIFLIDHVLLRHRRKEARPAGAGVELRIAGKQRQPATHAGVNALELVVEQRAAERMLGALVAGDLELLRRKLRPPLVVGLDDLLGLDRPDELSFAIENVDSHGWHCRWSVVS